MGAGRGTPALGGGEVGDAQQLARDRAHSVEPAVLESLPPATRGAALALGNPGVRPGHRAGLQQRDQLVRLSRRHPRPGY
ncbi:hypothetical protein [Actinacidiphila soli]|uniref:hypothetical protein n=1 Tax=Actinacidiphila soli TaxID=2487275 RepID=UPI000FCA7EC2|nr:hypothetical protein [Actinacidiphila soli]